MRKALLAGTIVAAFISSLAAQTRPDFSGTWTNTLARARSTDNLYGVVSLTDMTISQDQTTLTIHRMFGRKNATIVLKLDGSRVTHVLDPDMGRATNSGPRELVSQARWKGNRLEISTQVRTIYGSAEYMDHFTTETLSIPSGELVIERTEEIRSVSSEPTMREIMPPKEIYKRRFLSTPTSPTIAPTTPKANAVSRSDD